MFHSLHHVFKEVVGQFQLTGLAVIAFYVPNPYNTLHASYLGLHYEMNYASLLPNSYTEALPLNVMLSELGQLGSINQLSWDEITKMEPSGWDWCSWKNTRESLLSLYLRGEKTQQEGSCLQIRKGALIRTLPPSGTLFSRFSTSRTGKKLISVV